MNRNHIFPAIGASALAVALVAIPGSTAQQQVSRGTVVGSLEVASAAEPQEMQGRRVLQLSTDGSGDDQEFRVFVNGGGSWLGVGVSEVTADKVKELKLPAERGVVLGKIVPDSPAAKAGLKESDVVTEINGQRVEGTEQFRRMIREIPAGRTAQLTVWRNGRAETMAVTLGKSELERGQTMVAPAMPGNFAFQMPEIPEMGEAFGSGIFTGSRTRLGIDAENIDGAFGNYFGAPDGEGILVRGVFPDSPAEKAGIKGGDVNTTVNGQRVRSVGELRAKISGSSDGKATALGVIRNKAAMTLSVEIPAPEGKKVIRNGVRTSI